MRDSVIRSWASLVSRDASCRIRPAKRRTASGSSAASSTVSASSASAPTGVLSSWLTLATKSRRTSSTRRLSVWSSASSSTRPPPPTPDPSGATRTAKLVVRPPNLVPATSISPSRISPSRRTWRARASNSPTISRSPFTRPNERAAALARSTRSSLSMTTAEEDSTERTAAMPAGSRAGGRRSMDRSRPGWVLAAFRIFMPRGLPSCSPPPARTHLDGKRQRPAAPPPAGAARPCSPSIHTAAGAWSSWI